MLGKGLESLIPNKGGNGDDGLGAQIPMPPDPQNFQNIHEHADSGPQILSFDFNEEEIPVANEDSEVPPKIQQDAPQTKKTQMPSAVKKPQDIADYVFHIETGKIKPNPNQPRKNFSEAAIDDLARSIREFGFLQPLVATRREKETADGVDVQYELISGERRLLAAKKLGLERVPVIIRNVDLEREKLEMAIIENVQREDLSPIERARAFQRLQEEFRLTQREIAAKLGKSREAVANAVRLLDLPEYIQDALENGKISESHGRFLLAIGDQSAQKKLFDDILVNGLTTRDVKQRVQSEKPKQAKNEVIESPETKMLEEKLSMELGTPVKIERGVNTGKILITFYSEEELQNIVQRFGGEDQDSL